MDPKPIEQELKTKIPILQMDEEVDMAFQHGRDLFLISNKRVLSIDIKGMIGKKIKLTTFPFRHVKGFSIFSSSILSTAVQVTLFVSKLEEEWTREIGKRNLNVFEVNNCLGNKILKHNSNAK